MSSISALSSQLMRAIDPSSSTANAQTGPSQSAKETKQAAAMLEQLFMRELMKAMRETVPESSLFGEQNTQDIYSQMFDEAIAEEVGRGGGVGLSKAFMEQLGGGTPVKSSPSRAAAILRQVASLGTGSHNPGIHTGSAANTLQRSSVRATEADEPHFAISRAVSNSNPMANPTIGQNLKGIQFESPNRPNPVKLQDNDGRLIWPTREAANTMLDPTGSIQTRPGAEIMAAGSGQIIVADQHSMVVDHGQGIKTRYVGLGKVLAQSGDLVLRGQTLGTAGAAGSFQFEVTHAQRVLQPEEITRLFGPTTLSQNDPKAW